MHRFLFVFIVFYICVPSIALAKQEIRAGDNNRCHYITNTGSKNTGDNWTYYFCGPATQKCAGKKHKSHDKLVLQYNGDSFSWGGNTYWCCGGTRTDVGQYVQGDWITKQETETVKLETGRCQKKIKTTICGDTIVEDCDEPDDCNPGLKKRNGECIKPCGENESFESETSNKCIPCPTTAYQGIGYVANISRIPYEVCLKCDKDSEFYDNVRKGCFHKSSFKKISKTAMQKCWKCPVDYIKDCVIVMEAGQDNASKPSNWDTVKKECDLE